jgi:hypothetical protein
VAPGEENEVIISTDLPYNFRDFSFPQMVLGRRRQVVRIGFPPLPWGFQAAVFWGRIQYDFLLNRCKRFLLPRQKSTVFVFYYKKELCKVELAISFPGAFSAS